MSPKPRQIAGKEIVIAVQQGAQVAMRHGEPFQHGAQLPPVGLPDNTYVLLRRIAGEYLRRSVSGAIIDDNQFVLRSELGKYRVECLWQVVGVIIVVHDDRNAQTRRRLSVRAFLSWIHARSP
tara:strand:+ start:18519 stop:18887 length:369 start_codon:yes stop_codon:yes gene_type:complete